MMFGWWLLVAGMIVAAVRFGGSAGSRGSERRGPREILMVFDRLSSGFDDSFRRAITIAVLVGVLAVVAASGFAAVQLLRPIERIRTAARRFASGFYTERVPMPAETELAALAGRRHRPRRCAGAGRGAPGAPRRRGGPRVPDPADHHPGLHGGPPRRPEKRLRGRRRKRGVGVSFEAHPGLLRIQQSLRIGVDGPHEVHPALRQGLSAESVGSRDSMGYFMTARH
jgi:HAMP domain-containing protein